jgi:hypothetical protein
MSFIKMQPKTFSLPFSPPFLKRDERRRAGLAG